MGEQRHRSRLIWKLYGGFLAVVVIGFLISSVLVDRNVKRAALNNVESRLTYISTMLGQMTANALFGELSESDALLNADVAKLAESVHTHLTLLTPQGQVVADSATEQPSSLPTQQSFQEVIDAHRSGDGHAVRFEQGKEQMFVAHAIMSDGKLLGFARSSLPLDSIAGHLREVRLQMVYGALLAAAVAMLIGLVISSRIIGPVRALASGVQRIGAGDFGYTIEVASHDEIGELATEFNAMTRNLRDTVDALDKRNRDMRLVLDNVSDGLVTIDRSGVMSSEHSALLERWFGRTTEGATIWQYLEPHDKTVMEMFQLGWEEALEGVLPLDMAIGQLPRQLQTGVKTFELSYTPILADGKVSALLVVIRDVTARRLAERRENEQRELLQVFDRMLRDRNSFLEFYAEAHSLVERLTHKTRPPLDVVRRDLHTLKGNASLFGLSLVSQVCHDIETSMLEAGSDLTPPERALLRERWHESTNRLATLSEQYGSNNQDVRDEEYEALLKAISQGIPRNRLTTMVSEWKLERATDRLTRFAQQAEALARRLGRGEITTHIDADRIRLPRRILAAFWSAFAHIVRNAVDHGLETRAERLALGKSETGRIDFAIVRSDDHFTVSVADDGRGVDWDRVAERARRLCLPCTTPEERMRALFTHGISTRDQATEHSGRGLGLVAMLAACEKLGGSVSVESERGRGSKFCFSIPIETISEGVAQSLWPLPRLLEELPESNVVANRKSAPHA